MAGMRQPIRIFSFLTLSLTLLLAGCQSIDAPKGTSKGATSFRFFERAPVGDQRFEEPAALRDQLTQAAIRREFESRGLSEAGRESDLMVSYLYIKQDNVSTMAIPTYYGGNYQEIQSLAHKKGVVDNKINDYFERGAILIDIMDTRKQKLVYRSFAKRDLTGVKDEAALQALIDSAVQEALADFFQ